MESQHVARQYAQRLTTRAKSISDREEVRQALSNVLHALKAAPRLGTFLFYPHEKREELLKTIKEVTSNKLVLELIGELIEANRMVLLRSILDEFNSRLDEPGFQPFYLQLGLSFN